MNVLKDRNSWYRACVCSALIGIMLGTLVGVGPNVFAAATTTVYEEDFTQTSVGQIPDGWSQSGGGDWGVDEVAVEDTTERFLVTNMLIPYTEGVTTSVESHDIDLSGLASAQLSLGTACDTEYNTEDYTDHVAIAFSNGETATEPVPWDEFDIDQSLGDTNEDNVAAIGWVFDIPAEYLVSTFSFIFQWITNDNDDKGTSGFGCIIDDIVIEGNSGASEEEEEEADVVLQVARASASPDSSSILVNETATTTGVSITVFELAAQGGNIDITELPVQFTIGEDTFNDVVGAVRLVAGEEVYEEYTVENGQSGEALVTFSFLDDTFVVGTTSSTTVRVEVDFRPQQGLYENNDTINASIVEANVDAIATSELIGDAQGTALGSTHTLVTGGVFAELVAKDATVVPVEPGVHEPGSFVITFDLTAFSDDFYLSTDAATALASRFLNSADAEVVGATTSVTLTSTADQELDSFRVEDGETKTFTMTAVLEAPNDGEYYLVLDSIIFGKTASTPTGRSHSAVPVEDFTTDAIFLLSKYDIPAPTIPYLTDLLVDGVTVAGFSSSTLEYSIELAEGTTDIPVVTATTTEAISTLVITQASALPGEATVLVANEEGTAISTYTIDFTVKQPEPSGSSSGGSSGGGGGGSSSGGSSGGGGGGGSSSSDKTPPRNTSIVIEDNDKMTNTRSVELTLNASDSSKPLTMQISEDKKFANASWVSFEKTLDWTLSAGNGVKTIYARFKDKRGNVSEYVSDTIELKEDASTASSNPSSTTNTTNTGSVLGSQTFQFLYDLTLGMSGPNVLELQERLRKEGFFTYPVSTGFFGPATLQAVKAYQAAHPEVGYVTGYVGPLTRAVLNAQSTDATTKPTSSEPVNQGEVLGTEKFIFNIDLMLGMQSNDVAELQKRLQTEGLFTYPTITGFFGPATLQAVKAYQAAHPEVGYVTGYVGPLTRAVLNQ